VELHRAAVRAREHDPRQREHREASDERGAAQAALAPRDRSGSGEGKCNDSSGVRATRSCSE
jgi:hypothetical protein